MSTEGSLFYYSFEMNSVTNSFYTQYFYFWVTGIQSPNNDDDDDAQDDDANIQTETKIIIILV